jgi:hypothetical protein
MLSAVSSRSNRTLEHREEALRASRSDSPLDLRGGCHPGAVIERLLHSAAVHLVDNRERTATISAPAARFRGAELDDLTALTTRDLLSLLGAASGARQRLSALSSTSTWSSVPSLAR